MPFCLKCKYYGEAPMIVYPDEYCVTFRVHKDNKNPNPKQVINNQPWPPDGEEWCIVKREDVVHSGDGENSGLVKIVIAEADFDNKKALVGIYNSPDNKHDYFTVPIEEIPKND